MIRLLSIVILFFVFIASKADEAKEVKVFPPYPDIWGYDISDIPAIRNGRGGVDGYRMPDGDIWFVIDHSFEYKDSMQQSFSGYKNEKFVLLKFFKGEKIILNRHEREELYKIPGIKEIDELEPQVNFKDGSILKYYFSFPPKHCFWPELTYDYFVKTDANGNEHKYSILEATSHVEVSESKRCCYFPCSSFFYEKIRLLNRLVDLGDDTFLAFTGGSNVILRFDKNLNTQFKPVTPTIMQGKFISRNFFVVDFNEIETLKNEVMQEKIPLYQTIHDRLLDSLKEKYK